MGNLKLSVAVCVSVNGCFSLCGPGCSPAFSYWPQGEAPANPHDSEYGKKLVLKMDGGVHCPFFGLNGLVVYWNISRCFLNLLVEHWWIHLTGVHWQRKRAGRLACVTDHPHQSAIKQQSCLGEAVQTSLHHPALETSRCWGEWSYCIYMHWVHWGEWGDVLIVLLPCAYWWINVCTDSKKGTNTSTPLHQFDKVACAEGILLMSVYKTKKIFMIQFIIFKCISIWIYKIFFRIVLKMWYIFMFLYVKYI